VKKELAGYLMFTQKMLHIVQYHLNVCPDAAS